jgi:hypothetical protein
MKEYLLFAWDEYYPGGGTHNYIGDFDTVDEAAVEGVKYDGYEVVRHSNMQTVEEGINGKRPEE